MFFLVSHFFFFFQPFSLLHLCVFLFLPFLHPTPSNFNLTLLYKFLQPSSRLQAANSIHELTVIFLPRNFPTPRITSQFFIQVNISVVKDERTPPERRRERKIYTYEAYTFYGVKFFTPLSFRFVLTLISPTSSKAFFHKNIYHIAVFYALFSTLFNILHYFCFLIRTISEFWQITRKLMHFVVTIFFLTA